MNFEMSLDAKQSRNVKKLFSQRKRKYPRKLKKAIKQCWLIQREDGQMSVTFNFLRKTKHQRKASRLVRILPETREILLPYYNGMYVTFKQNQ